MWGLGVWVGCGGLGSLTVGAELTEDGDFHFTFVWVNEREKKKTEKTLSLMGFGDKK